jgi:ribosomal protein L27
MQRPCINKGNFRVKKNQKSIKGLYGRVATMHNLGVKSNHTQSVFFGNIIVSVHFTRD